MSTLNVDKVDPQSGTTLELGTSGDTVSLPSGATLDISASTLTPPATMPASSGVNLTALNATQLTSGTVPDARFPATLPAASGVNLTSLDAANLGSNTVPTARLGSGTASSSTVLYGDQTYKTEPTGGYSTTFLFYEDPEQLAYKDLDSTGHMNTDSFDISEAGVYLIQIQWRIGWQNMANFLNTYLGTSSAGGQVGSKRLLAENFFQNGVTNANSSLPSQWVMSFGTSLTYPYTVYVNNYSNVDGSTNLFNAQDANGVPAIFQTKLRACTPSTGMVQVGD